MCCICVQCEERGPACSSGPPSCPWSGWSAGPGEPGPPCQASHCSCSCDNVLMVIGGQYFNATTRLHDMVHQVEVLGPHGSCEVTETHSRQLLCLFVPVQISPLPSPLYGLTAGRVGDTVYACGGYHHYYRQGAVWGRRERAAAGRSVTSTLQLRVLHSTGRSVTSTWQL